MLSFPPDIETIQHTTLLTVTPDSEGAGFVEPVGIPCGLPVIPSRLEICGGESSNKISRRDGIFAERRFSTEGDVLAKAFLCSSFGAPKSADGRFDEEDAPEAGVASKMLPKVDLSEDAKVEAAVVASFVFFSC